MKLFCQIFYKTPPTLPEKPLHQRSRSRFRRSRSPGKQPFLAPCTRYRPLCVRASNRGRRSLASMMCHADVAMFMHGMDGCLGRPQTATTTSRGRLAADRFAWDPGKPPTRDPIKMWCGESDFEPRIRKFVSYVTPHSPKPWLPKSNLN